MAAIFYDTILVFCIVFIAWQPVPLLPELPVLLSQLIRLSYLFLICFLYFGWSWYKGGQTLGMKAWKIKLISEEGTISWRSAFIRFMFAVLSWSILGLGFLMSLFHKESLTWHDLASNTRLTVIKKNA